MAPVREVLVNERRVRSWMPQATLGGSPAALVPSVLGCELPRPLLPLLVTDDFFLPVAQYTPAPPVEVWVPPERNQYDGRRWRVHAQHVAMARALLDDELWSWLDQAAQHGPPVCFFTDGSLLAAPWPASGRDEVAMRLAGFADRVTARLDAGLLDAWVADPALLPSQDTRPGRSHVAGTSWELRTPDREVLFYVWNLWPGANPSAMVRDHVDGIDFVALQEPSGASTKGFVLLPLARAVPDHVHYARGHLAGRGNVTTEWLDFDDDFHVRAQDPRVGLAVTTPRLMEYLYDHKVHRMDVKGPWLLARVKHFDRSRITQMVRTLAGARELLPRHDLG